MRTDRLLLSLGALILSGSVFASAFDTLKADDPVSPGVWTGNFAGAKAAAEAERRPMVLFWSQDVCSYCDQLKTACESPAFQAWQKDYPAYFVFVEGAHDDDTFVRDVGDYVGSGAMEMARFGVINGVTNGVRLSGTPFVALYRPLDESSCAFTNFVGRTNKMLSDGTGETPVETRALQLRESIAGFFASVRSAPAFLVSGTPTDRLEIERTTTRLVVPLVRTASDSVETNALVTSCGEKAVTNTFAWAAGETRRDVTVDLAAADFPFAVGGALTLSLTDESGAPVAQSAVAMVERPNAVSNPYFIGECADDALRYSDWTLDVEAAARKVEAVRASGERAYLLAFYSGVLWCPYCRGVEDHLLASNLFRDCLETNRVQLALFDQALSPTDPYPGAGQLLDYAPGEEHVNAAGSRDLVSGAAYLSRHGLAADDPAVVAVRERSVTNSWTTWKAPESTAVRLSTPTFLLIGSKGQVVGRLSAWRDRDKTFEQPLPSAKNPAAHFEKYYDPEENVGRLRDLLLLADREDESSDYRTTTRRTLSIDAGTAEVALQVNDTVEWLRLTDVKTGRVTFTVSQATPYPVTLSYVRGSTVVASAEGRLTVDLAADDLAAGSAWLKVSAFPTASTTRFFSGEGAVATTAFTASLATTYEARPGTLAFVPAGGRYLEAQGPAVVTVARTEGATGEQSVRVTLDEATVATNGVRFVWTDRVLTWADGVTGSQTVEVPLVVTAAAEGDQAVVLRLEAATNCTANVSRVTESFTIFDTDEPCVPVRQVNVAAVGTFGVTDILPVWNVSSDSTVTVTVLDGSLPKGVSLVYRPETQTIAFAGVPAETGRYETTFVVSERRPEGLVTGWATTVSMTVADPKEVNAYSRSAWTTELELFEAAEPERLAGVLTLSSTSRGKLSARLRTAGNVSCAFSGAWRELSAEGLLVTTLERGGRSLRLELDSDGGLAVAVDETLEGSADLAAVVDAAPFAGLYSVTLPVADASAPTVESSGTGYLSLKLATASALRTGTVAYSGRLANGTAVSGSARLAPDAFGRATYLRLPVLKATSRDGLAATLRIRREAERLHLDEERLRVVLPVEDVLPLWRHDEKTLAHETELAVYGSWFAKGLTVAQWMEAFDLGDTAELVFDTSRLAPSETHGAALAPDPTVLVASGVTFKPAVKVSGLTFSVSRYTGVFCGSAKLSFADGRTVSGTYRGVLLPGWLDCGCGLDPEDQGDGVDPNDPTRYIVRPFASGAFVFRDTVGGRSVNRGLPVEIRIGADK